jgi:uncharacterized protein
MKKYLSIITVLLFTSSFLSAQSKDYKVIFDVTSHDTVDYKAVVRQISGIIKANPDAKLEVAIYGEGLSMVIKGTSIVADAILEFSKNNQASFKVCAATMKRHNIDQSMLVPGVDVVPDAIFEIITKQKEGFGYIKVAH